MKIYKTESNNRVSIICAQSEEEAIEIFMDDKDLKFIEGQKIEESDFEVD